MQIQSTIIQEKNIRYSIEGEGDTIVLLHGFIERIEIWEEFSSELSKTNKVVCIELPGHGDSDVIDEIQTMEKIAGFIHQLILQIEITNYVMIGHSMGGYIALAYAEEYEDELCGVGLFHSNALADSDDAKNDRERAVEIIKQDKDGFIFNFIPKLFAECNEEGLLDKIKWLQSGAKKMSKESLISCIKGMSLRSDKITFLLSTNLPMMFILGKEDIRIPLNSVVAQSMLPKHSETLILGDCGHMGYLEKPIETLNFIRSFTKNCQGKS